MSKRDGSDVRDPAFAIIGSRIAELRTGRGISKEELGRRTGLSPAYIWRIEDGRQNLQLRTMLRIAAGLDVTLSELAIGLEARMAEAESVTSIDRSGKAG